MFGKLIMKSSNKVWWIFVCIILFGKNVLLLFGVTGWFEWMPLQ